LLAIGKCALVASSLALQQFQGIPAEDVFALRIGDR
jgi:hypothetical protein